MLRDDYGALDPLHYGMEIMMNRGVDLYMSSLPAFGNTKSLQGLNGIEEGGDILMWFCVDVLGDEP